jgi:hypothetical protein
MKTLFVIIGVFTLTIYSYATDLISEQTFGKYVKLSGLEMQYKQMVKLTATELQRNMVRAISAYIKDQEVPDDIKYKLNLKIGNSVNTIKYELEDYFENEIKFKDIVNKVYLPVHRTFFSEKEMLEVIKFYQSPTGKKISSLSPEIMNECSSIFNNLYGNKIEEARKIIIEQEMSKLYNELVSMKK